MGKRSLGREIALSTLFQADFGQNPTLSESSLDLLSKDLTPHDEALQFAKQLLSGYSNYETQINDKISSVSTNWKLYRMAPVDKAILRLAATEMLYLSELTPPKVVLNEAIELAKKFGTKESASFVNGLLDQIRREIPSIQNPA
jgi:N utilization substance protein B